jgi:hypothetical protein
MQILVYEYVVFYACSLLEDMGFMKNACTMMAENGV